MPEWDTEAGTAIYEHMEYNLEDRTYKQPANVKQDIIECSFFADC